VLDFTQLSMDPINTVATNRPHTDFIFIRAPRE
jgi:hypothetical protein